MDRFIHHTILSLIMKDALIQINCPTTNHEGWGDNPIRLSMLRSDIANYLGVIIETVSRTISELKQDQIIKMIGTHNIFLNNKDQIPQHLI